MSMHAKAVRRFRRLDKVRLFPEQCDRCGIAFNHNERASVIEVHDGNPLVMHKECADRHPGSKR